MEKPKPIFFSNLLLLHILTFLHLLHLSHQQPSPNPDLQPLLSFKHSSDSSNKLTTWTQSTDLCSWTGVSCLHNRVSHLNLEGLNLTGSFESLTSLNELRVLSLKHNHLSGSIPDLSNLTALKLLFLSNNYFSGEFPSSVLSLYKLFRLDLSFNNLSGPIPVDINHLTHLITLKLEQNRFTGPISRLNIPNLQDFNVSDNQLSGEIPESLSSFPVSAFHGNSLVCGVPLTKCRTVVSDPSKPNNGNGAIASPLSPISSNPAVVSSSPTSQPITNIHNGNGNGNRNGNGKIVLVAIAIIIGVILVLILTFAVLFCYFWRKMSEKSKQRKTSRLLETEKIIYSSSPFRTPQGGIERGNLVFFEGKRFELEDLLRASAEMLGKGGFGTAYKAVLDNGDVVAVKRLKEVVVVSKKEVFEQHMDVLGKLRHGNVVTLKAYYFARDEKLLVSEFMPNGSLFWLLHGNRGPGRTPLDWTTRLKIASGVARGLAFIHHYSHLPRLSHGNVKSTNVLIDSSWNPRVTDFGLSVFASPSLLTKSNGYRAPEASFDGTKFSPQKADIYSFGVLLLEILTGKCPLMSFDNGGSGGVDLPRWVQSVVREEWTAEVFDLELMRYKDIEEEMVGLLQIGMSCTSVAPDQRPGIGDVLRMIEEIRGAEEVSPSHESFGSTSESPSLSDRDGLI